MKLIIDISTNTLKDAAAILQLSDTVCDDFDIGELVNQLKELSMELDLSKIKKDEAEGLEIALAFYALSLKVKEEK